jgi:hypothetical protein
MCAADNGAVFQLAHIANIHNLGMRVIEHGLHLRDSAGVNLVHGLSHKGLVPFGDRHAISPE